MKTSLCLTVIAFAAIGARGAEKNLSEAGKRRILQNLTTLEQNLTDTQENITITSKNIQTLEAELKDLDMLQKEHQELKQKFTTYIANALKEIEKNDKAVKDLEKFERNIASAPKEEAEKNQKQLETAQKEKSERLLWKTEANLKVQKMNQMSKEAQANLQTIEIRRKPLNNQLHALFKKQKEYERLAGEIKSKNADVEKTAQQ